MRAEIGLPDRKVALRLKQEDAMRIATFNVENLFDRAKIMNLSDWDAGKPVLDHYAELNSIFEKTVYSSADKKRIEQLLIDLGLTKSDATKYVILRRNRGKLLTRKRNGDIEVTANGRGDWIGWLELKEGPVNETAVQNTGRVIRDVDADILAVIEAEDRVALKEFSEYVLGYVNGTPYANVMLIDGNDRRGIDVGLLTREGFDVGLMRSHVHERSGDSSVFSRDCPEFQVTTQSGEAIWLLINHFKSKGYGSTQANNARRKLQAQFVAGYYDRLKSEGHDNIVVLGDLNDKPGSGPLKPLLEDTDLKDVSDHPTFDTGEFEGKGTYGLGNDNQKIDYLLLSPALYARISACGVFRKGAWPGLRPRRWTIYPEIKKEIHVASDHHALWVDIA